MATFPTLSRKASTASGEMIAKGAIEAKFGGYTQRAYDGINTVKENFSITYQAAFAIQQIHYCLVKPNG